MPFPLVLGILTSCSLDSKENGRRIFEIINSVEPALVPEKFDLHEPIRRPFSYEDLDTALAHWGNGFLWERKKPKSVGHFLSGPPYPIDDVLYIDTILGAVPTDRVVQLMGRLATEFEATLGYVDCYSDVVLADIEHYQECVMPYSQGLTTHHLKSGLPGLSWVTYFGTNYVELIGVNKLRSAPAYSVQSHGEGIVVRLTENPGISEEENKALNRAKLQFIEHVGVKAFRPFCYERLSQLAW